MSKWLAATAGIAFAALVGAATIAGQTAASVNEPSADAASLAPANAPPVVRRLTQEQYRNIVRDVFGSMTLGGRFEPDPRAAGSLIAVGAGKTSVTASSIEEYYRMGRTIAGQVVGPQYRDQLLPCKPVSPEAADTACTQRIVTEVGRLLFRRSLTPQETARYVSVAADATEKVGDYYEGLQLALAGMMVAPQFLFIQEQMEPDPAAPGKYRLTSTSMATRISFALWNTTPDLPLLEAAERGELQTEQGLAKQIDRMISSPRFETGVRAFFVDMMGFELVDDLSKDAILFPNYNGEIAIQGQEQTLRTLVDLLVRKNGDYRDIFTTRQTYMTPLLASAYQVQMKTPPTTLPNDWAPFEWPPEVPQAGIITQLSFVSLHSHPGKTSPTLRGRALRESLLCQRIPDPPPNVNSVVLETADISHAPTMRDRLSLHVTNPSCASCHNVMDPIGFALENFDTVGAYRRTENGKVIDTSGTLDGKSFVDAAGLGQALHDSPRTTSCLVQRAYAYSAGRDPTTSERRWFNNYLNARFADDGYRLPLLMRRILTNPGFYSVTPATPVAEPTAVALNPAEGVSR